jgi:hypothetical protein
MFSMRSLYLGCHAQMVTKLPGQLLRRFSNVKGGRERPPAGGVARGGKLWAEVSKVGLSSKARDYSGP